MKITTASLIIGAIVGYIYPTINPPVAISIHGGRYTIDKTGGRYTKETPYIIYGRYMVDSKVTYHISTKMFFSATIKP